jgi:hypothetical protein
MAGLRMAVPKGRIRIDRQRGEATGYAHRRSAEEHRLAPPGHQDRIAAHEARVASEVARLRLERSSQHGAGAKVPAKEQEARRQRVALYLARAAEQVTRPELQELLGISTWCLWRLLQHPWFHTRRRVRKGAPKGGGHLPSIVTLTPQGRAAAERLAREGDAHADR